jgi:hypothetical protein
MTSQSELQSYRRFLADHFGLKLLTFRDYARGGEMRGEMVGSPHEAACLYNFLAGLDEPSAPPAPPADLLAALEHLLDVMEPPRSRKASEAWDAAHAAVRRARAVAD